MIKIKIQDLLNSTEALQKLAQTSLKARPAFYVSKMLKAADKEIQEFNETRMNLIKKYGEKDENGELITDENQNCKIPDAEIATFSEELNELVNTEVEINANKLKIEDLENVDFTPNDMSVLETFIDFGETEEPIEG